MKNTFRSTNQFWTEIAASAGLIGYLATASSTLSAKDVATAQFINDYGVANGFWRPEFKGQILWLIRKVLTQATGAAD